MKIKISFFFDEIFKIIILFFLSLVLFRSFKLSFTSSLCLAIVSSITMAIILFFISTKKKEKNILKLSQLKKIEELKTQISFASAKELNFYLQNLLNANINSKKELAIDNNKIIFQTFYNVDIITNEHIKKIYRENKNRRINKIVILCYSYAPEVELLIKNFKKIQYEIMDIRQFYLKFVEPKNTMPNFDIEKEKKENLTLSRLKLVAFSRHKSKSYFLCGLFVYFSSYFVPLKTFYLVFAGIMFLFAILCLTMNSKFLKIKKNNKKKVD